VAIEQVKKTHQESETGTQLIH